MKKCWLPKNIRKAFQTQNSFSQTKNQQFIASLLIREFEKLEIVSVPRRQSCQLDNGAFANCYSPFHRSLSPRNIQYRQGIEEKGSTWDNKFI